MMQYFHAGGAGLANDFMQEHSVKMIGEVEELRK
jgi:hypothetical protein